jgi:adenosylmethionine-8-amino-7-oxononanoate aminotransferase
VNEREAVELARLGARHLWLNFSPMSSYTFENEVAVIVRGEREYVYDSRGKKYLDGVSSLLNTQVGHGREELIRAVAAQHEKIGYFPLWGYAHEPAIRLAARLARLAPGDLNRVFFTTGGAEANETAWKLARQYYRLLGKSGKYKVISRDQAYHGTAMGALSITGIDPIKLPFEPLVPGGVRVMNTNHLRLEKDPLTWGREAADDIEAALLREGPDTVAMVVLEPVQNAGGCLVPPRGYFEKVREICDLYDVLLVIDEVITSFGRLGYWFASEKYNIAPDIITCAKGMTSAYAPIGAMIASDRLMEPFREQQEIFLHGYTFSGHPVSCAVALANIDLLEGEGLLEHVRTTSERLRGRLESLFALDVVGDVRGDGFFFAIELVKHREGLERFSPQEALILLYEKVAPMMYERGLIARVEADPDPVIVVAPPLTSGDTEFDLIAAVLRDVLGSEEITDWVSSL